ncbi:hypothetical protein CGLO_04288 [Colletotrichum gloeosporioides Cg-14]|uniref:Uncharacterized protein n=1 Tax=Colletotrichum gloeosporioides (strain Cg-14) TaxID=1237896 RepID=T0KSU9_COLGC|nr:hypothetical protein CGLO_04288 [Colletotrichum gloeosporioides Cg-14]
MHNLLISFTSNLTILL